MGESVGEILLAPLGESPNFLFSVFEDLQALAPARSPPRHLLGSHSFPMCSHQRMSYLICWTGHTCPGWSLTPL